jgi:hypothetical protein
MFCFHTPNSFHTLNDFEPIECNEGTLAAFNGQQVCGDFDALQWLAA